MHLLHPESGAFYVQVATTMCTHARTHTRMHARTHARTHTHTHTHTHACTHTHTHTRTHTHTLAHTFMITCSGSHVNKWANLRNVLCFVEIYSLKQICLRNTIAFACTEKVSNVLHLQVEAGTRMIVACKH